MTLTDAERIQELEEENKRLEYLLAGMLMSTNMVQDKYRRGWWMCPVCRSEHKGLDDLEMGIGHDADCDYALARQLLKEIKK
jgi:hypothetical protein